MCGRSSRHVLVGFRGVRQRGAGGEVCSYGKRYPVESRDRFCRCFSGLRFDGLDDGLCHRSYLRLSPESRSERRIDDRQTLPIEGFGPLHHRSGNRRNVGSLCPVFHRVGKSGFQFCRSICDERIRRIFAGQVQHGFGFYCGSRPDVLLLDDHSRSDRQASSGRIRSDRDRIGFDFDPPDRNPSDQSFGQPCTQHRTCLGPGDFRW